MMAADRLCRVDQTYGQGRAGARTLSTGADWPGLSETEMLLRGGRCGGRSTRVQSLTATLEPDEPVDTVLVRGGGCHGALPLVARIHRAFRRHSWANLITVDSQ